jgi:hypothetical protein
MELMLLTIGWSLVLGAGVIYLIAALICWTHEVIEDDKEWERWQRERYGSLKFTRGS